MSIVYANGSWDGRERSGDLIISRSLGSSLIEEVTSLSEYSE